MVNRLREARERAGLSVRELAARCDVHPSQISRLENGRTQMRRAGAGLVHDVAKVLGVSMEWLIETDD